MKFRLEANYFEGKVKDAEKEITLKNYECVGYDIGEGFQILLGKYTN